MGRSGERVSKELEVIAHDDLRLRTKGPFSPFSFLPFSEVLILISFCRETPSKKKALWSLCPCFAQGQGLEDKGRADGQTEDEDLGASQGTLRKTHNLSDKWSPYRGSESKLALS